MSQEEKIESTLENQEPQEKSANSEKKNKKETYKHFYLFLLEEQKV